MSLANRQPQKGGARKPVQDNSAQNRRPAWKTQSFNPTARTGTPPATNGPATNGPGFPPLNPSAGDTKPGADGAGSAPNGSTNPSSDAFRTDTEISQTGTGTRAQRELQAWQAPADGPPISGSGGITRGDDATFGPGTGGGSWDQFVANEQMFGVTTSFDEDVYTTKLDRTGADFKERERKAQQLADEITGATSNNPHLAEERNQNDDSGVNEEDKYGAVVRSANAYVPPGARKGTGANGASPPPESSPAPVAAKPGEPPKVKTGSPDDKATKPPGNGLYGDFRDFVATERKRLEQKKQAIIKNDRDKRIADLVNFSKTFKLGKTIPEDLVPILAKDEDKQKAIREKSAADASANTARSIGPSGTAPTNGTPVLAATNTSTNQATTGAGAAGKTAAKDDVTRKTTAPPAGTSAKAAPAKKPTISMVIQKIPPFDPAKARAKPATLAPGPASSSATPASPSSDAAKLNVNAPSFNVNAPTFKPGTNAVSPTGSGPSAAKAAPSATTPSATTSPHAKPADTTATVNNPFFGVRPAKKAAPVHIKDDFNPFKFAKVVEPANITAMWPYNGKRYIMSYPAPPPQNPPPQHLPPGPAGAPGQPAPPPPPYEEDPAQQAAAAAAAAASRGYMVYYPQYYPGQYMPPPQAMMQGAPGAPPPQGYIHGFVPHMYPAPMPHGAHGQPMYPPPMPGMPPPQQYMPPPPGAYPAPPPGAAPGSMPQTPMPAPAAYYHPGPQFAYPMMMAPPPGAPGDPRAQHPYQGAQPGVPMQGQVQHQ